MTIVLIQIALVVTGVLTLLAFPLVSRHFTGRVGGTLRHVEIIMRETAILGILGITTLGFDVDSAMEALRFDVAMVLILVTAVLNIGVDALARYLRRRLRLRTSPVYES